MGVSGWEMVDVKWRGVERRRRRRGRGVVEVGMVEEDYGGWCVHAVLWRDTTGGGGG